MASVSSKVLLGSSMTRRKTLSGGSHATFNFGCHNELQDFATNRAGSDAAAMLAVQHKTAAFGVELPEAVRVRRDLQNVAGIPAGHVKK